MMGAQPCNRGQLANRKIVRQMRFDIVDYPVKTGRTQAAAHGHRGRAAVGILAKQMDNRRSEEHTSELQSLMRSSYAVFCLKQKKRQEQINAEIQTTNPSRISHTNRSKKDTNTEI